MSRNDVTEGYWNQTHFPHLNKLKPNCPTDIKERLPSIEFSGELSNKKLLFKANIKFSY